MRAWAIKSAAVDVMMVQIDDPTNQLLSFIFYFAVIIQQWWLILNLWLGSYVSTCLIVCWIPLSFEQCLSEDAQGTI